MSIDHLLTPEELELLNDDDVNQDESENQDDESHEEQQENTESDNNSDDATQENQSQNDDDQQNQDDSDKKTDNDNNAEPVLTADDLNEIEADLDKKFDDGEMSNAEYREQLKLLNAQRENLIREQAKVEIEQQSLVKQWETAQKEFFSADENKIFTENEDLFTAFDGRIRKMGAENPEWSGKKLLDEAAKAVKASFGIKDKPVRQASRPIDMPSLSKVPAAAHEDPRSGEFAYLDKLEGLDLEKAISALSPDKLERYLAS